MENLQNHDYDTATRSSTGGPVLTPVESRQAVKTGHIRWILAISVSLAVIAGIIVYALFG